MLARDWLNTYYLEDTGLFRVSLSKLPRFEKKLRVALDWTLDLLFTKDLVQFQTFRAPTISHADEGESSFPLSTSRVIAARALESVP